MKHTKFVTEVLARDYFVGDKPVIPYLKSGSGRLVVVTGENASGKSFFGKVAESYCHLNQIECMRLSMHGRQDGEFGGLRFMVYGDETSEATSINSIGTVLNGIKTCQARTNNHVIIWDEPDIGLSDGAAAGLGVKIREFAETFPKKTLTAFVITHSKALVAEIQDVKPTFLYLGDAKGPKTLEEWLQRPAKPISPEDLSARSKTLRRALQQIINSIKASVKSEG